MNAINSYLAAYLKTMALWKVPFEVSQVCTRFGLTNFIESGPEDAPPLILLPGLCASATIWYPNVGELSREFRTLAIDVVGDAGKSLTNAPPRNRLDYAVWLIDLLNVLGIDQAYFAGLSYGGFLALNFAIHVPDRVKKLVLLAPAGLLKLERKFLLRAWWAATMPMISRAYSKSAFDSLVRMISTDPHATDLKVMNQMFLHLRDVRTRPKVKAGVFSDQELRRMVVPTLVLHAEKEVIYDPVEAQQRVTRLLPYVESRIIPGAGHTLNIDRPDVVNERMLDFLTR